jgi:branched-chain amino acid aminotransferase
MAVMIERKQSRAAPGGIGNAKTGGNYAASLQATTRAVERGFTVALWLDLVSHQNIEELSGMNLFAVIGNELLTPALVDSILPEITRDSLFMSREYGYRVVERTMPIDELLDQIQSGQCSEMFASGTAAVVAPIKVIADADGREFKPVMVDVRAQDLRMCLLAIKERTAADPFGWTTDVALITR